MGALSYADDITLIAPSIGGLNEMLKLCDNYVTVHNVMFNSKKTVFITHQLGPRYEGQLMSDGGA